MLWTLLMLQLLAHSGVTIGAIIPASLHGHLQYKLTAALQSAAADHGGASGNGCCGANDVALRLVDELVEHAPTTDTLAWARNNGLKLARLIAADSTIGTELANGCLSIPEALAAAECRTQNSARMFEVVQVHHASLRQRVHLAGTTAWDSATADQRALQRYGEAAFDVGKRRWAKRGIDWCARTALDHFHGDAAVRRARKRASREYFRGTGEAMPADANEQLRAELAEAARSRQASPIKLLDVGSCGFLFGGIKGIECMALDLCPQDERTLQADFLRLHVGPSDEPPAIAQVSGANDAGAEAEAAGEAPSANKGSAAGCEQAASANGKVVRRLDSLPAASFDAVVFSLVFSYLPLAEQRAAMVAQARKLLRRERTFPGLLLLVDTFSSLGSRSGALQPGSVVDDWVQTIEGLGFELITRQTLERSHALAFAAAPLPALSEARDRATGANADGHGLSDDAAEEDEPHEWLAAELEARLRAGARLRTRPEVEREARAEAMRVSATAAAGPRTAGSAGPTPREDEEELLARSYSEELLEGGETS